MITYKVFSRDGKGNAFSDEYICEIEIDKKDNEFNKLIRRIFKFKFFDKLQIEVHYNVNNLVENVAVYRIRFGKCRQVGYLWRKFYID
jgi:hypothetical protein